MKYSYLEEEIRARLIEEFLSRPGVDANDRNAQLSADAYGTIGAEMFVYDMETLEDILIRELTC